MSGKINISNPWRLISIGLFFVIALLLIFIVKNNSSSEFFMQTYSIENVVRAAKCRQSSGEWHFKDVTRIPENGLMVYIVEKARGCTCPEEFVLHNDRCTKRMLK